MGRMYRLGDWDKSEEWSVEEDCVIECFCEACGHYHSEEVAECEECGSESLLVETSHEGVECSHCGYPFDIWEDWFVNKENKHICKHCYNELDREELDIYGNVNGR